MTDNITDNGFMSPYIIGFRRGLIMGLYLSLMFLLSMTGSDSALSSLLFIIMAVGVPILLYRWLRHTYIKENARTTLSGLWMQGIAIFAGGALISTTVAIAYFRWFRPQFIYETVNQVIDMYRASNWPQAIQTADTLQHAMDAGILPSARDIALEMFWLMLFCGSLLSLITAVIVRARKIQSHKNKNQSPIP